ncbi:MAG: hypothetical protein C0484_22050 [Rhodospirillum sp.]|nr:hypothetical protein [Rhodospirillum sp.]
MPPSWSSPPCSPPSPPPPSPPPSPPPPSPPPPSPPSPPSAKALDRTNGLCRLTGKAAAKPMAKAAKAADWSRRRMRFWASFGVAENCWLEMGSIVLSS